MLRRTVDKCEYFTWDELRQVAKNMTLIKDELIMRLDELRGKIGYPIIITSLDGGEHMPNSYHYKGKAVDCKIKGIIHPNKILQAALDCGFRGIGMYSTFWHFDIRLYYALWKRERGTYKPLLTK